MCYEPGCAQEAEKENGELTQAPVTCNVVVVVLACWPRRHDQDPICIATPRKRWSCYFSAGLDFFAPSLLMYLSSLRSFSPFPQRYVSSSSSPLPPSPFSSARSRPCFAAITTAYIAWKEAGNKKFSARLNNRARRFDPSVSAQV